MRIMGKLRHSLLYRRANFMTSWSFHFDMALELGTRTASRPYGGILSSVTLHSSHRLTSINLSTMESRVNFFRYLFDKVNQVFRVEKLYLTIHLLFPVTNV